MNGWRLCEWMITLTDAAAWAWPQLERPAQPRRFAADAEGHAALLRCLGARGGEARSQVVIDLAGETLHETQAPALNWRDRRALAGQCRRTWFAADGVAGLRWLPRQQGGDILQGCGVQPPGSLSTWLHLLAHSAAPPAALHSATWLGEQLAHAIGADSGAALLLQPGLDGARLSWLTDGVARHTRRLTADGEALARVLDFFASQPDYPAQAAPKLWVIDDGAAVAALAGHPALAGHARQRVELAALGHGPGWADWLTAHVGRRAGDYRGHTSEARPSLRMCAPHVRRGVLMASLATAALGTGWFVHGEMLDADAARLSADVRSLHVRQQALASALGPDTDAPTRRAADGLLALRAHWPRLGDDLDALATRLAGTTMLRVDAAHWRADPAAPGPGPGEGARVQLELRAAATASPRQALAELHQLLADCRKAGWQAQLSHAPFDTRADATLTGEAEGVVRFVVQLTLPARGVPP